MATITKPKQKKVYELYEDIEGMPTCYRRKSAGIIYHVVAVSIRQAYFKVHHHQWQTHEYDYGIHEYYDGRKWHYWENTTGDTARCHVGQKVS